MARFSRLFSSLMLIMILLGVTAGSGSARALRSGEALESSAPLLAVGGVPENFELIAENDLFQLYLNKETVAFKVVDKRSGYIWHSNLDEKAEGDKLNKTWTAFATSGISIEYLDEKAVSKRISISNSEHTLDVKLIDRGFEAVIQFSEVSITVGVVVQLEAEGVRVQIPFESIQEAGVYRLGMIHVYPFFGATRGDSISGYMFIPDGSGSLIHFTHATKAKNMLYARYYGTDLGMISILPYDPMINRPFKASIPVIGMVHGYKQNAYLAIVENGASYGEIQVHPAGIITNFNFLYNAFIYNQSYFQATNRSGAGVTTIQPKTNQFDVSIYYRFLSGNDSDYVGMAISYQRYLAENNLLNKVASQPGAIGLRLEFLGAEKEKILFWNRTIPMTTIAQMADILDDLDIQNLEVVYYGWQPYGASSMPPTSLKLDGALGSRSQLKALVETIRADGGDFYLYLDPQAALWEERGYSPRNDLAMSITNVNLTGYNRHKVNYYFNLETLDERYTSLSQDVSKELNAGLVLDGIGSSLYSDFKPHHLLNREGAIAQYQQMFARSETPVAFYLPNDYFFGHMDAYFDMPISSSGYIFTDEAVPFLQVVLAGYIPYYGPALNFSSNAQEDLLRLVDFGVYPAYFLSYEETAKILNTYSNWIYSSSYDQWEDEIKRAYAWMNALLGPVVGQNIVAREILANGVMGTTYGNGYQIVVNYNETEFTDGGFVVNGRDAGIRKVEP